MHRTFAPGPDFGSYTAGGREGQTAKIRCGRRFELLEALPKTSAGKLDKKRMRQEVKGVDS